MIVDSSRSAAKDVNVRWPNGVVPFWLYRGPDTNQVLDVKSKLLIFQVRAAVNQEQIFTF